MRKLFDPIFALFGLIFFLINEKIVKYCMLKYHNQKMQRSCANFGKGSALNGIGFVTGHSKINIGENVQINANAIIRGEGGLTIGDNTHIAKNIVIYTHNHNYEGKALPYDDTFTYKEVSIGKNVWIGINVTILPGTQIGDGAIIGAGSVVKGEIPPLSIYGASEGKVIKTRNAEHYNKLESEGKYGGPSGKPL